MEETDRDTSGRFTGSIDDADVIAAVRAHDPAATSEIGEELGISRQGADRRLRSLRDAGDVSSKKIGASLVWFIPRDRGRRETGEDAARADAVDDATDAPADPPADTHGAEEDALAEQVREYLADTDTPPKTEHGRAAIVDVFRYLREHGAAKTGDIQDAVYPEYADEWGSERTMWNTLDRYLNRVPGVEKGGYGEWTYTGDDAVRAEVNE